MLPQFWQKFAPVGTTVSHLGHFLTGTALAKQEVQQILREKSRYDLDQNGVLDEHELELAMEWTSVNEALHPSPNIQEDITAQTNRIRKSQVEV